MGSPSVGSEAADRKSTRLNSSHSLHDALPIWHNGLEVPASMRSLNMTPVRTSIRSPWQNGVAERWVGSCRSEEHTAELQSLPARRSSDLAQWLGSASVDALAEHDTGPYLDSESLAKWGRRALGRKLQIGRAHG